MISHLDIKYKENLVLDLHMPESEEFDLFIYFHGGGLEMGSRKDNGLIFEYLAEKGIATASVDYRMFPTAKYPDFIEDCAKSVAWIKENALRIFTEQTEGWAKKMGVSFQSVSLSSAKTRWGTCSEDNKIRYAYRLLYAPRAVVEYVVVHELAHTRHKDHGKAFWGLVERYVPDYKARRKWLKEHGTLMEIF